VAVEQHISQNNTILARSNSGADVCGIDSRIFFWAIGRDDDAAA